LWWADHASTVPSVPTFELYEDSGGEWRWRLVATNGNIIADSGEGYNSKQGAERGIDAVRRAVPEAEIEEV
jgi:uncharacterized protein YegP (UPF0339 family)